MKYNSYTKAEPIMIFIDKNIHAPLYSQIYEHLKEEILCGNRKEGELLPGIRTLASTLGVSINTVDRAYSQLAVEGYIKAQKGACFIVQNTVYTPVGLRRSSAEGSLPVIDTTVEGPQTEFLYDFEYGSLMHDEFPVSLWRKYTTDILFSSDSMEINKYQSAQGDLILRQELKKYLYRSRGVKCSETQIVLASSLQSCLDMLCKLLRKKGRKIGMEEPGYNGARDVFLNNDFELHLLPATEKELDLSTLPGSGVNAVYVTPSHQFPYGTALPIYQRQKLLDWAVSADAYIIEDDYDSDYRYDADPIPSLQSIDHNGRVIYIGTFSKALSPSLRVNYMVLPQDLLLSYQEMFSSYHPTISWLTQRSIAKYMQEGRYERHVRKMSLIYKKRHDAFAQEITEKMGSLVNLHGRGAGLHFMLEFPNGETLDYLIEKAAQKGIRVYSPEPFWHKKEKCPTNLLFMGYSILNEMQIRDGISLLRDAWF